MEYSTVSLRPLYDVCACMYTVYVRAMQMICRSTLMIDGVASLALLLQSALCSQSLAACCDVSNPVFEVFRKLRAFDLHTEKIRNNQQRMKTVSLSKKYPIFFFF